MGKIQLDIFNCNIYRHMINLYNEYLNALKKYVLIDSKMYGYYEYDEISYIVDVYCNLINEIINGYAMSLFVPQKAMKEILNIIKPINNLKKTRNYDRIISKYEIVKQMITIEELI